MKQIKGYLLPKDTERLYKDEAISSVALSREVAEKLNEVIEYVNELYKNDIEKEMDQDGRIRKAVLYMKDNLSNSLHELLELMKANGEVDSLIVSTVNDTLAKLDALVLPVGNALTYGAKGNGTNDDTLAIKSAITDAKKYNKPLIIPEGKYLVSADLDLIGISEVDIKGEIVTNGNIITIGSTSDNGSGIKVNIKRAPYIKVVGVKNSLINIDYCDKLHIYADGDNKDIASSAYTQFYGAFAKEVILESTGTGENIGWINENVFRIKRIEKVSMSGNYAHNNNHFEHINFEKGALNLENARNNYISARCEGEVTITEGEEVNHNFLEKEYYYKHYFGDDVVESAKGTLTYFPVNKLQTEKELLIIDKNNKSFPIGSLIFKESGVFTGVSYNSIYHSDLVPIDKTFALKIKSNAKAFRVQLRFYDENKTPILTEVDNFADGKMKYNGEGVTWNYSVSANTDSDAITFYPGRAKYVEYNVIFGNNVESVEVEYIQIKLLKYINTDVHISNKLKNNVYTQVPTTGYWEEGQILYGKNPAPGTSVGIVCTTSGMPGVWNNFGSIAS